MGEERRMRCSSVHKKISAYLDGELSEDERKSVAEHLETCRGCQTRLEELSRVSDSLDLLAKVSAPPFFAARVKRRISEQDRLRPFPVPFVERVKRATVPVAAGVLLCFSVLIGGSLGKGIYELRADRASKEELEIVDFLGVSSFNGASSGSLAGAYSGLFTTEGE
jgi:anti-sigma factor RsiW